MHTIIRSVRRTDGLPGIECRLAAVAGRYLFPAVEAQTLAASLAADDRAAEVVPLPQYKTARVYLPGCEQHAEHTPCCPDCTGLVDAWLEELREHASPRTDPAVVGR